LEALGLTSKTSVVKKTPVAKKDSGVKKLIPTRTAKGRRTAQEEQAFRWICAAGEAMWSSKEPSTIPPVICLPCLEIMAVRPVPAPVVFPSVPTPGPVVAPPITPPEPAPIAVPRPEVMSIDSTIRDWFREEDVEGDEEELEELVEDPEPPSAHNGVLVEPVQSVQSVQSKSQPVAHETSDLDQDLLVWMEEGFRRYIRAAGLRVNMGPWGYRMARMAIGLDVMAQGSRWVRECFERFVGGLFDLLDAARSQQDLVELGFLIEHAVYLDVLAEIAGFQTKNGHVSNNVMSHYEDKVLALDAA
jgi:hypothetical protein